MRGMGRVFKRGSVYWIEYWHRNKQYRESSKSAKESDAARLLKQRLGELAIGKPSGHKEERLTFEDIASDYLKDCQIRGEQAYKWGLTRVNHLRRYFGMDIAIDITAARIRVYIQARRDEEGAANATINRDLAVLSKMFSLAIQSERLRSKPYIPRLPESEPRQGFMEHAEYLAIRQHLPLYLQDFLDFGYHSGWRRREISRLEWQHVDLDAGVIRLRQALSKNKDGRLFALAGPLRGLIEKRWQERVLGCPYVFHRNGKPIGDIRKSWYKARRLAGLDGKLFHDLRRTTVRNLVRAGVPDKVAMSVTGHKTRSVFDRYNIVSEADLQQATERLVDYLSQQSTTPTVVPLQKNFTQNPHSSRTIQRKKG